jgi:hypothetical protein
VQVDLDAANAEQTEGTGRELIHGTTTDRRERWSSPDGHLSRFERA